MITQINYTRISIISAIIIFDGVAFIIAASMRVLGPGLNTELQNVHRVKTDAPGCLIISIFVLNTTSRKLQKQK